MEPKPSSTIKLVTDIELKTASAWTAVQRIEVADLIREYRFAQVTAAMQKIQRFLKENGAAELSEKIFLGDI